MLNALKRVERNKGAAGIDGMKVEDLRGHLKAHWLEVRETLESEKYRPSREILLRIANRTKERFMEKIRHLTKRTRSGKLENIVRNVNQYVIGWIGYYRLATTPSVYKELDEMDKAKAETDGLEALETGHDALPGVTEAWSTQRTSRTWNRWEKPVANVPNACSTRNPEQRLLASHRA